MIKIRRFPFYIFNQKCNFSIVILYDTLFPLSFLFIYNYFIEFYDTHLT